MAERNPVLPNETPVDHMHFRDPFRGWDSPEPSAILADPRNASAQMRFFHRLQENAMVVSMALHELRDLMNRANHTLRAHQIKRIVDNADAITSMTNELQLVQKVSTVATLAEVKLMLIEAHIDSMTAYMFVIMASMVSAACVLLVLFVVRSTRGCGSLRRRSCNKVVPNDAYDDPK